MEAPFPFLLKKLKIRKGQHDRLVCNKKDCTICQGMNERYIKRLDKRFEKLLKKHPEIR